MKCPGQDRRYWTGEPTFELPCPKCGTMVEVFRDESSGRCVKCSHRFPNPKALVGCARWCPQAKECLGSAAVALVPEGTTDRSVAARLVQAVEKELAGDPPQLAHALLVFQHARELLEREGGDSRIVLAAALLLPFLPEDPASCDPNADHPTCVIANSTTARQILQHAGFQREAMQRVCHLIRVYRTTADRDRLELKLLGDAEQLAQLTEQDRETAREGRESIIKHHFHTAAGQQRACELFAKPLE
jgi:hypothetical protein